MYQLSSLTKNVSQHQVFLILIVCAHHAYSKMCRSRYRHAALLLPSGCWCLNMLIRETENHASAAHHSKGIISKKCFQVLHCLISRYYQIITKQACSASPHSFRFIWSFLPLQAQLFNSHLCPVFCLIHGKLTTSMHQHKLEVNKGPPKTRTDICNYHGTFALPIIIITSYFIMA